MPQNIEIKARCANPTAIQRILEERKAKFIGIDHQIDTYFSVQEGRLKLREGNIEQQLIFYRRNNQAGPKKSEVILYPAPSDSTLKAVLTASLGIKVIVDKKRAIYFIDNVKFHIDTVARLGNFLEIEAIDRKDEIPLEKLEAQCRFYMNLFDIQSENLVEVSYSDMLLAQEKNPS